MHGLGGGYGQGEVGDGGTGAHLAGSVGDGGLHGDDVAPLRGDASADGDCRLGGGDRSQVASFEAGGDARGLEFAGHGPAADFIEQKGLDATVEGVNPALEIGRGRPEAHDVVAVFVEFEMEAEGVRRAAPDAVISGCVDPWVVNLFHNEEEKLKAAFWSSGLRGWLRLDVIIYLTFGFTVLMVSEVYP